MKTHSPARTTWQMTLAGRLTIICPATLPLLLLLALARPAAVQAQDYTYTTNNDTITITSYTGPGGAVTIPSTIDGLLVTGLGQNAFGGRTDLTSVTIPDRVTFIGQYVFGGCTGLTSVTIPDSVTFIGVGPFYGCTSLTAIVVGSLNSVFSSRDGVLFNKNQTLLVQYPAGRAGSYAVPDSVTRVGGDAFGGCTSLTSVTIPDSVTIIGEDAFYDCTSLTAIVVGPLNSEFSSRDGVLFNKTQTRLIQYPAGRAGSYAIPGGVTGLGEHAFAVCTRLTSVTIPDGVTVIGQFVFSECTSLTSVTIPNSVTTIEGHAFYGCTGLTAIVVGSLNSEFSSRDGVLFNRNQTRLIQFPAGKAGSYAVPDSVTAIDDEAFSGCASLTNVAIPTSVINIGGGAFRGCIGLTSVTIPDSVTVIGPYVFSECSSLTSITIPNSVTSIGYEAFQRCTGLTSVTIPESVTTLGAAAFQDCTSLTNATIAASVAIMGNGAFSDCTSLTNVYFSGNAPHRLGGGPWFPGSDHVIVYYLPGTTGWDTFDERPTVLWSLPYPVILGSSVGFDPNTDRFGFRISWSDNQPVVIDASSSSVSALWTPVGTNSLTSGWSYFSDPEWTNHSARLYRLRSP